ncbi:MAG: CcmD family protein [Actinobacteria bacterium]|nr:MAG: CcmD family protein [Actinomycetota bacterium]
MVNPSNQFVIASYAGIWLFLLLYVFALSAKMARMRKDLSNLKEAVEKKK